jgi:tRNA pseudouridine38-40 synthase
VRIALVLEYDGAPFCGWQTQPSECSVQDALERALAQVAGRKMATICAGRTDAGVHALHQVVHFDATVERPLSAWVRGVNSALPSAIAVTGACEVADDFHARYGARERRYRYLLLNRPARPALEARRVGWCHRPLDAEKMTAAARLLLGRHDFSAVRAAECQARSPVRELRHSGVARHGDVIVIDLAADAFLQHMVRNIVGCLIYVGNGKYPPEWLAEVLAARDRARAAPTADAAGLYLAHVVYDDKYQLPPPARPVLFDMRSE